jgi:protein-S-isoprenylcysteine O-methyltransferase Ste14
MVPAINWLAVALATISSMAVGAIFYARKVFGNRWMRLAKIDPDAIGKNAVLPLIITLVVSFITASVLAGSAAIAQEFYGGGFLLNCVITATILWAGFTAARLITHDLFERRPGSLTVLNLAHELITVLVMALIIGAFGYPG